MTPADVVHLTEKTVYMSLLLASPLLMVGMVVGMLIALFQATTQIQEMTLTFVPKIFAVMLTMLFLSSWMMAKMLDFTTELITSIPMLIR